jgi:hypothetical protein
MSLKGVALGLKMKQWANRFSGPAMRSAGALRGLTQCRDQAKPFGPRV